MPDNCGILDKLLSLSQIQFYHQVKNIWCRASLVAQWLRIRLPMQGTWVRALIREDPICRRTTKPMHHNYWAWALEPVSHNYWACEPQLLKPTGLQPVLRNKRSPAMRSLLTATKSSPRSSQLEKATKTQSSQKKKNIRYNILQFCLFILPVDSEEEWSDCGLIKHKEREAQEGGALGTYVCIWLIHFGVQQKLTQYCEAITLQ